MEAANPHLRLLSLKIDDELNLLSDCLSDSEKVLLANKMLFKDATIAENKCSPILIPRNKPPSGLPNSGRFVLDLIPQECIQTEENMFRKHLFASIEDVKLKLEITTNRHMIIEGMEILTRARNNANLHEESFSSLK